MNDSREAVFYSEDSDDLEPESRFLRNEEGSHPLSWCAEPWPKDPEDAEMSTAWWIKRMEKENRRGGREEEARRGRKQSLGNQGHRGVEAWNPTDRTSRAKEDRAPESLTHWAGGTGAKVRTATRNRGLCSLGSPGPHWWGLLPVRGCSLLCCVLVS